MGTTKKGQRPEKPARTQKELAQDDQVMGTNNSSIVSKRSVERLYYPDEPHFFRYFVKKFQRRAPLINRGYHLRLHVIDVVVRDFLHQPKPEGITKVVINLGCGYDVLPWQCLTRYTEDCRGAKFLDVDFPDLIQRKRQMVLTTPELRDPLTSLEDGKDGVVLKSDEYVQIGCDLRDLAALERTIGTLVDIKRCAFLFVAEVSITYMENNGADGVIQWASTLGDAEFCLLEQILPDGPRHPFAKTMLSHFDKLNTQLKSVETYQTLEQQVQRFGARGWGSVEAWTLWQAWADDRFLSAEDRRKLDRVEPFDEWEEFALFGSHYCLIHAATLPRATDVSRRISGAAVLDLPTRPIHMGVPDTAAKKVQRRFGASMSFDQPNGKNVANFLGLGNSSRLESYDVLGPGDVATRDFADFTQGPSGRMCHSLLSSGLLTGGRTSPSTALKTCYLLKDGSFRQLQDLPQPLYRHAVARLDQGEEGGPCALLIGGRNGHASTSEEVYVLKDWGSPWEKCKIEETVPVPVSGAFITCLEGREGHFRGIYGGGIQDDGVISDQLLAWELRVTSSEDTPIISMRPLELCLPGQGSHAIRHLLARYGATCMAQPSQQGHQLLLLGGVVKDHILPGQDEILLLDLDYKDDTLQLTGITRLVDQGVLDGTSCLRPLLVGASMEMPTKDQVAIVGGGATCFSMGTYWNTTPYTLELRSQEREKTAPWELWKTQALPPATTAPSTLPQLEANSQSPPSQSPETLKTIPRLSINSPADFAKVLRDRNPVVLTGLDLGPCTKTWDLPTLTAKIGPDRPVTVHDSPARSMDFIRKNFAYRTLLFADFATHIAAGARMYLRALSDAEPSAAPAQLAEDFPGLAGDFSLPPALAAVAGDRVFSSVLRVSGPVNMWLHYDVMANVYCQISGSKRMILFPPADVARLAFRPGASSSALDVFDANSAAALRGARRREAVLGPGDVLFLPPLWLHAGSPESETSIAVNVFFRDEESRGGYAAGRDVYGNRDLAPYERGRLEVAKIAKGFEKLPQDVREFYLLRLAEELRESAQR